MNPRAEGEVTMRAGLLNEQLRREIFAALVDAQDEGVEVAESHQSVAARYGEPQCRRRGC